MRTADLIYLNDYIPSYKEDKVFILAYEGEEYRYCSTQERFAIGALEEYLSFKGGRRVRLAAADVELKEKPMETVKIQWTVSDGYVGKSRPQFVKIPLAELLACDGDEEVNRLITEYIEDAFERTVSPSWDEEAALVKANEAIDMAKAKN